MSASNFFLEVSISSPFFENGKILLTVNILPVSSMTANLQPLKKPGSKPKTILPFNGACKSNFSKFIEKISIDLFCALSLNSERISRSIDGNNKRSQPSTTASYKTSSTIVV